MNYGLLLTLYVIAVPVFIIIDLLWLGFVAKSFYFKRLSHLMGDFNWLAAAIFYLVFLLGLTLFAIYPTATKGTLASGLVLGSMYGFFTYATYDLTNLATLRQWSVSLTIVDIVWGTFLGAAVTATTFILYAKLFLTL
jgi:uncharacterized membrane protein